MESTTRTGTRWPCASVSLPARASESSLLPQAVGPQTTSAVLTGLSELRSSACWLAGVEDVGARRLYRGCDVVPGPCVRANVHGMATPRLADGPAVLGAPVADLDLLHPPHL